MPALHFMLIFGLAALIHGCQSTPSPPANQVKGDIADADPATAARLRTAFTHGTGLVERMQRLAELESQALELMEYEPLKLGAIGSAILDLNYASLSGHVLLQRFYEHVEADDAAALHEAWATAIKAAMAGSATGQREDPYSAISPVEAQLYVSTQALSPVGLIYQSNDSAPFVMLIQGRPAAGQLQRLHFDLGTMYQAARLELGGLELAREFSPGTLMGLLARQGDPAAQTALGALLAAQNRTDDAIGWLRAAARVDNVIAQILLARIHRSQFSQAELRKDKQAALDDLLDNYLHAIALGSSEAMYNLAVVYLQDAFGEDNRSAAIPLLQQAGELNNSDALLYLAYLHYGGEEVEQDQAKAREHFIRSATLKNNAARLGYARLLMRENFEGGGDGRAIDWLKEMVQENADPEAMLMLGNLHARGVATKQNLRTAYKWYRGAAKEVPESADVVNEVAWTLTVSDLEPLRRVRFANRIMTNLMQSNEEARAKPEYLDTWAATYAATGNFTEAVRLQELALQEAASKGRTDVVDILQEHLTLFLEGKQVVEQAP